MTTKLPIFYFLEPTIQSYEWGNTEGIIQSFVSRLTGVQPEKKPMAELWQGDHVKSPSLIRPFWPNQSSSQNEAVALNKAILKNPSHFLGNLYNKGYTNLPFLFKILDAAKPLSIQAHPDKKLAEKLHKLDPINYTDSNHKPEIAISLNKVEAMAGFRPLTELQQELNRLQPLRNLLCQSDIDFEIDSIEALHQAYSKLMLAQTELIESTANQLINILNQTQITERDQWFLKLIDFYGKKDSGVFAIYLFNYITLEKGQAIYLDANQPHAYLKGEILECMASSDNVVRGGLTSKFKDIPTLLSMLSYETSSANIILPTSTNGRSIYYTPAKEFQVSKIDATNSTVALQPLSIVLLLEGSANLNIIENSNVALEVPIKEATILFIPGDISQRKIQISIKANKPSEIFEAATTL